MKYIVLFDRYGEFFHADYEFFDTEQEAHEYIKNRQNENKSNNDCGWPDLYGNFQIYVCFDLEEYKRMQQHIPELD